MRLTLINQFYTPDLSPTAHLSASLAEHRAALGDDVTVIAGRGGYVGRIAGGADAGVRVIRLWTPQLGSTSLPRRAIDWMTFYVLALVRAAMLPRQDIVVVLTTPPFIALAGVLHKMLHPGAKLVLWNMDCYPEALERTGLLRPGGWIGRAMRAVNRFIFRRLDHLVCLDQAMVDLLAGPGGPAAAGVPHSIIPNWERAALFPSDVPPPQWGDPLADELRDRFVVLYLGNAGYGHEFATVLEAAAELRDSPAVFLFVGGGALRPMIEAACRRRGLTNVRLHAYVPKEQTPDVMGLARCALITLENAAAGVMSPSKLHANLAMGLPIVYVGPAHSNVDEAIGQFDCGLSCRPGDTGRVAQFVRELAVNDARAAALGRNARRAFDEAYNDRQALPRFDAMFGQLLAGRASAQPAVPRPAPAC